MPDDERHAIADQFLCGHDRLLRITRVIDGDQLHLLSEHAALGVEVIPASSVPTR